VKALVPENRDSGKEGLANPLIPSWNWEREDSHEDEETNQQTNLKNRGQQENLDSEFRFAPKSDQNNSVCE